MTSPAAPPPPPPPPPPLPPLPLPFFPSQPRLSRFSLRAILSLPRRLCSPPPAVGKVRSFGLTPIFDIRLHDVLDRKHLPPLSLKDFEEWLLYVEQSVENLYFVLWLREYTAKYDRWIAKVRAREAKTKQHHQLGRVPGAHGTTHHSPTYRVAWSNSTPTSPALALFFSRARETFLVPGASYELSLPPALLDALAVVNGHPDPAVFAPARAHVEDALRASLNRCVRAAYSNVGTYRAACGIAAGIFILLVGTVPPLAVNFVKAQSRWERLVILPGLWLGLTILIASLRGICMMIYIFGDFRQLRKFELVRPPPPTAAQSHISIDSRARTPTAVIVPARPVQALTAPPRIAIRIPAQNPTLSYATSTSTTVSTDFSGTSTHTSTSYTNTTSHVHTISISSVKSRGGTSTLVFPHHQRHGSANVYADSETRSVPGVYASDDDDDDDAESFNEDEDDGMSTASDHGIYISPAMPSPEAVAEDDPAVVNAALALIASGGSANGSTSQVCAAGMGMTPVPASPSTAIVATSPMAIAISAPHLSTTTTTAAAAASQNALRQVPTARFIPAYPYSDADSVRASRRRGRDKSSRSQSQPRSHSRSQSVSKADLEACVSSASPEAAASVQKLGAFDFDALPMLPKSVPSISQAPSSPSTTTTTKVPAPPAPTLSLPASRPRPPERCLDTNLDTMGIGMNETNGLTMLPSPCSGLTTTTTTAYSPNPSSPFGTRSNSRLDEDGDEEDRAGLCEKKGQGPRSPSDDAREDESDSEKPRRPNGSIIANWGSSDRSRRKSRMRINLNLPFFSFSRLPSRFFSLFHPRHQQHHTKQRNNDSTGYDAFPSSPYTYTSHSLQSSTKSSGGRGLGKSPGAGWRTRCALEARVPAFGPVTRVLAPVVARAQWEIVVRAACLAALLTGTALGVLVSLPVPGEV